MRAVWVFGALGLVGACTGAQAPTCADSTCAGLCATASEAQAAALDGAELVYLDPYESERLSELLPQVVRGVLPDGDPAMRVCAGPGPCWDAPPLDVTQTLPGGLYSVSVRVVVPPRGTWKLAARMHCFGGELPTVEVDLTPSLGKVVSLDPMATFDLPADGQLCHLLVDGGGFRRGLALKLPAVAEPPKHPPYDQPE